MRRPRFLGPAAKTHLLAQPRQPFFYGWVIVGVAALAGCLGSSVNNVAMAVIFKPLSEDLGWSRSLTAGAIALGTIASGLVAPVFGRLADRYGPRLLQPAGAAAVAALALGLSLVTEPWQFYATYVPARALAATLLFGVVPLTAVTNWFYLRRPRAYGFVSMAVPLGSSAFALVYQMVISTWGWRTAFLVPASLLLALVAPAAALLRRRPEELGLSPDGSAAPTQAAPRSALRAGLAPPTEQSLSLGAALRTRTLWLLVASETLAVTSMGGVAFHLAAYYTDVGIAPLLAAGAVSTFGLSGAVANLFWGFLAERVFARKLYLAALLTAACAIVLLFQVRSPALGFAFALVFGLSARGQDTLVHVLLAHYFGRTYFGSISGLARSISLSGLGVGPLLAGAAFDLTGSYQGVFAGFLCAFLVAAGLVLLARRPARDQASDALAPSRHDRGP